MRILKTAALAPFLLLLAACGPGDDSAAGSASDCTDECLVGQALTACDDVIEQMCAYIYRCGEGQDLDAVEQSLGFGDEASCVSAFGDAVCADAEIGAAVREARQRPIPGNVPGCLSAIDGFECLPLSDFFLHPTLNRACDAVMAGMKATGDGCVETDDCAGYYGFCNSDGACESRGAPDYGVECDIPIGPNDCAGDICLTFKPNAQGLTGMCSRDCESHSDCGEGGMCAKLGDDQICLVRCASDSDCFGGHVCLKNDGEALGQCFVEAS